jgi:hypothetical protein
VGCKGMFCEGDATFGGKEDADVFGLGEGYSPSSEGSSTCFGLIVG